MSIKSRPKTSKIRATPHKEMTRYVLCTRLGAACFLGALVAAIVFVAAAPVLGPSRLSTGSYYAILVILGLLAAGSLYGTFWSYARSHRRRFGLALEIGGPAVVFVMVLIVGFVLPGPTPSFPLIVAIHREADPNESFPRGSGRMVLDLGTQQIRRSIDTRGRAVFAHVAQTLLGQEVGLSLESNTYVLADPNGRVRLNGTSIDLTVRKK